MTETCKHTMREGEVWIGVTKPPPYQCSFCEMERLQAENAELRELVIEIAMHFDPMFGTIDLHPDEQHRLNDSDWMNKAAKVVGEDEIFPWMKVDKERGTK